MEEMETFS